MISVAGAAFTRFQTLRLQQVFPDTLQGNVISYGSCQFPTLGFVVERYKAIESFIPEAFWKIQGLKIGSKIWWPIVNTFYNSFFGKC